jgi:hypothetical protein
MIELGDVLACRDVRNLLTTCVLNLHERKMRAGWNPHKIRQIKFFA